ncbi:DUF2935 domain-containing protein [Desulfosporosinus sp. PR]|uniref:DUF2935 domain-containing protein n=1 Tax=Candidatus Desulfosporosinus nitrosoreducens TaxID=3401928 RepID=UPI0027F363B2|nr:DUF2935 domain-containing protein [Desulfosporosinus sp. PR]MDQ7094688.1 DUF2935 domain-containing protein [Desulfosporosinus sp. PR]
MAVDYVKEAIKEEKFWNRQMAEHAQFIKQPLRKGCFKGLSLENPHNYKTAIRGLVY